jgi:hypothetical protein
MGTENTCITVMMAMMLVIEPADRSQTAGGCRLYAIKPMPSSRKSIEILRKLPLMLANPETKAAAEARNKKASASKLNRVTAMLSKAMASTLRRNRVFKYPTSPAGP